MSEDRTAELADRLVRRADELLGEESAGFDDENYVYGAFARAEALAADDPDWMNVTRWPRARS